MVFVLTEIFLFRTDKNITLQMFRGHVRFVFYHRLIFNERFENGKYIQNVHLETFFILGLRKTTHNYSN